jgi:hypothetical protein
LASGIKGVCGFRLSALLKAVHEVSVERYQRPLIGSEQSQALEMVRDDGRLSEADIDVTTGA